MSIERTFSIVKPNAVLDNNIGNIIARFEKEGLRVAASRFTKLTKEKTEGFYIEHKERPFFHSLVNFMTSGPVLLLVLEGENAVEKNRDIMGATNPKDAKEGTIRKLFAKSIAANAVHGSDSDENAGIEANFFFSQLERF